MTQITLIVGLPGSGKTHLANQLAESNQNTVVDDITSIDQLPDSSDIIITDVNFCDDDIYHRAYNKLQKRYGVDVNIDTIFFECNSDAARRNVKYRNDGRDVEGTIRRFEKIYKPPSTARKIWLAEPYLR